VYLLLTHLGQTTNIKAKRYNLVFKSVPCTGDFNPTDTNCLTTIETNNNLPTGTIKSATWLKRLDLLSPNQKTASLKVSCTTPESRYAPTAPVNRTPQPTAPLTTLPTATHVDRTRPIQATHENVRPLSLDVNQTQKIGT